MVFKLFAKHNQMLYTIENIIFLLLFLRIAVSLSVITLLCSILLELVFFEPLILDDWFFSLQCLLSFNELGIIREIRDDARPLIGELTSKSSPLLFRSVLNLKATILNQLSTV